jgi:hypothetical protein
MHPNAWPLLQLTLSMLFAAAAFGVVLSAMSIRGRLPVAHPHTPAFDIAHTDRSYQLASILASLGAMASLTYSAGVFAAFLGVAAAFQIAEHWLIPRLRAAREDAIPIRGARARFELVQAMALALIFMNLGVPPLMTLANVYGLR